MSEIKLSVTVDRPHDEASKTFSEGPQQWLPGIVGPDADSWRTETQEGPIHVDVVIEAGPVFVHSDGAHWRQFIVRPDRTSVRNLIIAILTPKLEGELGLIPDDQGRSVLIFEGTTTKRNRLTGLLERWLLGDPLAWSGINTVLDNAKQRLEKN